MQGRPLKRSASVMLVAKAAAARQVGQTRPPPALTEVNMASTGAQETSRGWPEVDPISRASHVPQQKSSAAHASSVPAPTQKPFERQA